MVTRAELKRKSKDQLKGRWVLAICVIFISMLLISGFGVTVNVKTVHDTFFNVDIVSLSNNGILNTYNIFGNIWTLLLSGVFILGMRTFLINFATGRSEAKIGNIFEGFYVYAKALGMSILVTLIVAIGFVIFIIPGIILALMYSQAFYILADDNSKSIIECMTESRKMMIGHKTELFVLYLSFIGWYILGSIPFGIGLLWVNPYAEVTYTNYYLELKNENENY